ncbi:hypothetical protein PsorP6_005721 [Peronosclerospora sorghi]|uniref:Uncharacterized protein n=1 Tax=Peronosclerospora sorghi TaxID=230839 RepID=A0ACC0W2W3_9STRA|nr:hypothetical protein PsorP6_005721 [Peronosclerospora sorghi]
MPSTPSITQETTRICVYLHETDFLWLYDAIGTGNPVNVFSQLAEIVRKFIGRESLLSAKLFKKYGEAPDFTSPVDSSHVTLESKTRGPAFVSRVKYQTDFKPYELPKATASPLDLRSARFNALEALRAPNRQLKLLLATAFPMDNIQKCRHLLPESDANRQDLVIRSKKKNSMAAESKASTAKKAPSPSLFEQLAGLAYLVFASVVFFLNWFYDDTYTDGPFRVLRRCFLERMRVFVVIRRVNSVRGTCSGFLKAFDKHMNLVLLDVTQECIPLCTHERLMREVREGKRTISDAVFSAANGRRNRCIFASAGGTQREYVKQLFIRGDNVVSVSAEYVVGGKRRVRRGLPCNVSERDGRGETLITRTGARAMMKIRLCLTLQHPKIVRFIGVTWSTVVDISMFMDYLPQGDLSSLLERQRERERLVARAQDGYIWFATDGPIKCKSLLALDIAEALVYLHSFERPIIHRDLKPKNVPLSASWEAKVTDFGTSRALKENDQTLTAEIGTVAWLNRKFFSGNTVPRKQMFIRLTCS